ncbi:MAG: PIG-L family deacetylase [Lachnospiraceae bacterium]|nr:PIG-L family deacetylase [Lachnospiraceae bacterium]
MNKIFRYLSLSFICVIGALLLGAFKSDSYASSEVTPTVVFSNGAGSGNVTDTDYDTSVGLSAGDTVTVSASDGSAIEAIYLIWNSTVSPYTITTDAGNIDGGTNGFIHEYVELPGASNQVVLNIAGSQKLSRVRVFTSKSDIPDDVQVWQPPCEQADILVFSSHADDEILFFGSAIAKYIYEKGAKVQLSYLTEYWTGLSVREHEKLDGLWTLGVRYYPVCGNFPDVYADSLESAKTVYNEADMIAYETSEIRRFKPLIVITHDFDGEYGHGFHKLVAESVATALENAADESYQEGASASYEVWDTPKAYIHNYKENAVTLDLRQPIDERGGLCPIEIASLAYKQHVSQQWCWFYVSDDPNDKHPEINSAAWGLYRTNVGTDSDNDFFENLTDFSFEDTRIHISTPEGLDAMRNDPSASYVLDDDIDMAGYDWTPFSFYGILNGNGHAILNLNVTKAGEAVRSTYDGNFKVYDTKFAGLFDVAEGATIKKLSLYGMSADVDIDESCFVGSIAGYTENTRILDCTIEEARITLKVNAPMFGVGGLVGYGAGKAKNCVINTTLVCVDKNKEERDEQYMGGVYGAGYLDVDDCTVNIDGYDSDHGYVHNGGIVGMYIFFPNLNIGYKGSLTGNSVTGQITFFEDNTNRRAYCEPIFGEVMIWEFEYAGNTESFKRNEIFDYSKDLYPNMIENPTYTEEVTVGDCYNFGYTTYTCAENGYSYRANYTLHEHSYGEGSIVEQPTYEKNGIMRYTCEICGYTKDEEIPMLVYVPEPEEEVVTEDEPVEEIAEEGFSGLDKKFVVIACVSGALIVTVSAIIGVKVSKNGKRRQFK